MGWVKRDVHDGPAKDDLSSAPDAGEEWYNFNDEKVTVVTRDKIAMLDGGGEDSTAYILLYR